MTSQDLLGQYQSAVRQREALRASQQTIQSQLLQVEAGALTAEQVRTFFNILSDQQRKELEDRVQTLVDYGVRAVFGDDYRFVVRSELRGKSVRTDFYLIDHGMELPLLDATGGGIGDVVSFLLRIVMLCLVRPAQRRLLVLDEPFKFVSAGHFRQLECLVRDLTQQLGLQIIMVTHKAEVMDMATTLVEVSRQNGVSRAKVARRDEA